MSKIFKISGSFMHEGKWNCPDIVFEGEFVLAEDNKSFCGFCTDQNIDSTESNISSIAGIYTESGKSGKRGLSFYKSASGPNKIAIICNIPNPAASAYGTWGIYIKNKFKPIGKARVLIEECPYSAKSELLIKSNYNKIANPNIVEATG